jgi:hypothetical protein
MIEEFSAIAWVHRRTARGRGSIESCISPPLLSSGDVEPASTLFYQPDLILYLVFEHFLRYHENHCLDWLCRGYLVLYLTDLLPPEALIIGMLLAPRLDFAVPTLEIVRIRLQPSLVTLPLAFRPAPCILTTLLDLRRPRIRFIIPPAIGTPLLSAPCCFHTLILTDEGTTELTGG